MAERQKRLISPDRLRLMRETAGLSRTQFAESLGVSRQTIFNWEHDIHGPGPVMLRKVAETLGVDDWRTMLDE